MDKGIECGVRFKEALLELSDDKFAEVLPECLNRAKETIRAQRRAYLSVDASATSAKAIDGFTPFKAIEFYCRAKGVELEQDFKGIECGIIIKQFAIELPDAAFESYLQGAADVLRTTTLEQRRCWLNAKNAKALDLSDVSKEVELYCSVKSMCS